MGSFYIRSRPTLSPVRSRFPGVHQALMSDKEVAVLSRDLVIREESTRFHGRASNGEGRTFEQKTWNKYRMKRAFLWYLLSESHEQC